jgi:hypothetical protein
VRTNELVLVQGMADTKLALGEWHRDPWKVLRPWLLLSFAIACSLLLAIFVIAQLTTPDSTQYYIPGYTATATVGDYAQVLYRNSLVLALHGMACVAGFIAGSSLPMGAHRRTGISRWVHDKAGPLAIGFVVCATGFSLCTQAYLIGSAASSIALQLHLAPGVLLLALMPHALPELMALFLPLAAWIIASRRDDWHVLLAATFVTVGIAIPVLLASAAIETWVSPHILIALTS